jgi:hypothetical protein
MEIAFQIYVKSTYNEFIFLLLHLFYVKNVSQDIRLSFAFHHSGLVFNYRNKNILKKKYYTMFLRITVANIKFNKYNRHVI